MGLGLFRSSAFFSPHPVGCHRPEASHPTDRESDSYTLVTEKLPPPLFEERSKGDRHAMTPARQSITELLDHWQAGDRAAFDKLVPLLYKELRVLAANQLRRERPGHTLPPTALVHEVYLQLAAQNGVPLEGRSHFFGVAARLMRQLLVNTHAGVVR